MPLPCPGRARAGRPSRRRRGAGAARRWPSAARSKSAGEAVAAAAVARRRESPRSARRRQRAVAGAHRSSASRRRRAAEQVLRIGAQAVGRVAGGADERTAVPSPGTARTAFQPTRPGNVPSWSRPVRVAGTRRRSASSTRVVFRPPCPARVGQLPPGATAAATAARRRSSARRARELGELLGEHRGAATAALLERRDLRLVEHVANVDAVARDRHRLRWLTEKLPSGWRRRRGQERQRERARRASDAPMRTPRRGPRRQHLQRRSRARRVDGVEARVLRASARVPAARRAGRPPAPSRPCPAW